MRSHVTMRSFGMFKPLTSAVEDKPDEGRYNLVLGKGLIGDGVPYPNIRDARDFRRKRQSLLKNSGATNGSCSSLQICFKSRKWQLTRAEAASNAQVVTQQVLWLPLRYREQVLPG
jgi:hypothetical protein